MKVVCLIRGLNVRGGTHKQLLRMCQYIQQQGVDVSVYTDYYDINNTYPEFQNINVTSLNECIEGRTITESKTGRLRRNVKRVKEIAWIISKTRDADIVNIHDLGYEREMILIAKLGKQKIVWQINDLQSCFQVGNMKDVPYNSNYERLKSLARKAAACADQITVNVTKNAERVKEHLKQKAKVFYCGVDANVQLKKHNFPKVKAEFRILSSGVFFPYRNYETQVKVIAELLKRGLLVRLDIIGETNSSPDYAEAIEKLIQRDNLEKHIRIWGQVNENIYTSLHDQADLFIFVNVDQSWGLAVFEAMSCGLPVIVSNSVGATEILHDGIDSVFVDPVNVEQIADRVQALIKCEIYYNRISRNAAAATQNFTWDKMYSSRMLDLFRELVQENDV